MKICRRLKWMVPNQLETGKNFVNDTWETRTRLRWTRLERQIQFGRKGQVWSPVPAESGGGAFAPQDFGRSVNPIPTRGEADCVHHITTSSPSPTALIPNIYWVQCSYSWSPPLLIPPGDKLRAWYWSRKSKRKTYPIGRTKLRSMDYLQYK